MKRALFLVLLFAFGAVLSVGCTQGPKTATDKEAQESMDKTMQMDTMKEAPPGPGNTGAPNP